LLTKIVNIALVPLLVMHARRRPGHFQAPQGQCKDPRVMNRKQFLWLMLAVVLLGGASLALFWQEITAYRDSGAKIGARLMPDMKISDVAKLRLQDAEQEVTLALKDKVWRVEQRGGYPADFAEISGFILKLTRRQSRAIG